MCPQIAKTSNILMGAMRSFKILEHGRHEVHDNLRHESCLLAENITN